MDTRSLDEALYEDLRYTGYHELAAQVIQTGMGYVDRWNVSCVGEKLPKVEGKPIKRERLGMQFLDLGNFNFINPGWILSPCGRFWAEMLGLNAKWLYHNAGGTGKCGKQCRHSPRHLLDKSAHK